MNQSYDKELILELIEKHKIGLSAVTFQDLVTAYSEIANDKEIVSKIQFIEDDLFSMVSKELREDERFVLSLARQNPSYAINIFFKSKLQLIKRC